MDRFFHLFKAFSARTAAVILVFGVMAILLLRYPANERSWRESGLPRDYTVYLHAWSRIEQRQNPYVASDPSPYKYSPGVLGLIQYLPANPQDSWRVFSSLCIGLLGLSLLIGARYSDWKEVLALSLGLAASWKGILETLDYGQIEILLFFIAVMAASLRRKLPLVSGFLAGTLPWFKIPWVLLFLPLTLINVPSLSGKGRKEKRVRILLSGYLLAWFFWGAAYPVVVFGTERTMVLTHSWLSVLHHQPSDLFLSDLNQSLWISLYRWTNAHAGISIGLGALIAGLLIGVFSARCLRMSPGRGVLAWISPWLILIQLLNPLSWRWGSVVVVGAFFSVFQRDVSHQTEGLNKRFRVLLAAAVFLLFSFQQNPVVQLFGYKHWTNLHGLGWVTLYWGAILALSL